jgi:L-threonylcarbamoyladenylate synthase
VLRDGGLVAFPTETVYGLGADATNTNAIRHLFAVKGRPADHPLIVHLGDAELLDEWAVDLTGDARTLAKTFWPGPLTLVVRRDARVPDEVTGGRDTVGVRVPAAPIALALLRAFGSGVAAPSANRFGRVSPTTAADVRADLGDDVDVILDGGQCAVGVESTIIEVVDREPTVLRPGGVPVEEIEKALGRPVLRTATGPSRAPGMLASHYAPRTRVELVDDTLAAAHRSAGYEGERVGILAPEAVSNLPAGVVALDPAGGPDEFARVLYQRLRYADRLGLDVLLVVPPPAEGVGVAVRDRLRRAAAGSADEHGT